ncbi:protein of unknown function DUF214 [Chloroherpeton thalassium ATCC 35110]|uniref:ABC3 transporter permease protein domain-containing protein n=1 Tax=Chloroherpeton thalassium (strain ATCC 35110 / GB-78) TaxID=517418 RepID=B3QX54_CHLT3|nr:ABC transporter permease [Chloroherpeton thalassium]ACF14864.1 protein of unknown function DUF214 [Chloroherpeton thalassium ATCC 35110]
MNDLKLVLKNIVQRRFSISLTALSVALGVALIAATLSIKKQVEENFKQSSLGYEMIVGAKGSSMQLVLNTVFMLGNPVGNIRYEVYESLKNDRRVALALPYALGDNFQGFKIVGTTDEIFSEFNYKKGKKFALKEGRAFQTDESFLAVLGSEAAKKTGLKIGDKFVATHGLQEETAEGVGHKHEDSPFTVAGILEPTGTTADKIIYTTLKSVWKVHSHELSHQSSFPFGGHPMSESEPEMVHAEHETEDEHHDAHAEHETEDEHHHHVHDENEPMKEDITAVIVKVRSPLFALHLYKNINDGTLAQASIPVNEIKDLFAIVSNVDMLFFAITLLVILVSLIGMMVAIYNSLNERRREIAIMRSLGAHKLRIFNIITLEAGFISFAGTLVGIFLGKAIIWLVGGYVEHTTGVEIAVSLLNPVKLTENFSFPVEIMLILAVPLCGAFAGIIPALNAYRTDVAKNLNPIS